MKIQRHILKEVTYPYAVSAYEIKGRTKVVTATELDGPCTAFWADTLDQETIWENCGGTMNTCQLDEEGDFLAIQRFYKGFDSRGSRIVKVFWDKGVWRQEEIFRMPFIHRFCTVKIEGDTYILCCILCKDKAWKEDWSQAGSVAVGKLSCVKGEMTDLQTILPEIHKNHGLFKGKLNGEEVILVTGEEGVFKIMPPLTADGRWTYEKILSREVSDCTVVDLDGDGRDELITIETFHGSHLVVNHLRDGKWQTVYDYPIEFGHALWSGTIFGKPSFLIGYRASNAALLLFSLKEIRGGDWYMDITVLDEHEGPANVEVVHQGVKEQIFSCSNARNRVMLYELSEE